MKGIQVELNRRKTRNKYTRNNRSKKWWEVWIDSE